MSYMILDAHGTAITQGLISRSYAEVIAQRWANKLRKSVWLADEEASDADGPDLGDEFAPFADVTASALVLCESPAGWSLHAPESSDDEIAEGEAKVILSGEGTPTDQDYLTAWGLFCEDRKRYLP